MKISEVLNEKPKSEKPGVFRTGGAVDRAIGSGSGFSDFVKKAQAATKRPGPKKPFRRDQKSDSKQSAQAAAKTKKNKTKGPIRRVDQIPDNTAVVNPQNQQVYQFDTGSKKWVNQKNPRDTLSAKDGLALYQKAMK